MREFAAEHSIPCIRTGKVIMATREEDLVGIRRLLANALSNQIRAELLGAREVKELEPYAEPYQTGIYCPDTATIDAQGVMVKLQELLLARGVHLRFNEQVVVVDPRQRVVRSTRYRCTYQYLINCAGAYADVIARHFGIGEEYRTVPFKGIYFNLRSEKNHLVRGHIYPVPDLCYPFLGVHLSRGIGGEVFVGPTAIPALGCEHYGIFQGLRLMEAARVVWHLSRMYLKNHDHFTNFVHAEIAKYRKQHFLKAVRCLIPMLSGDDLIPSKKVGIRPQLIDIRHGRFEMDYVVKESEHSIHVLNAISPAFTSAFAFADLLLERATGCGGFGNGRKWIQHREAVLINGA
jgi:L-2-hydroxyglutarate oxidase LhgO